MTETTGVPSRKPRPNPTAPDELPPSLREALRKGTPDTFLRDEVCAYVDAARRRGDPVERVIIDLKRELHVTGVVDRKDSRRSDRGIRQAAVRGGASPLARFSENTPTRQRISADSATGRNRQT